MIIWETIFETMSSFRGLKKVFFIILFWNNFKTTPSEKARGQPRELQASQILFGPWKGHEASPLWAHLCRK